MIFYFLSLTPEEAFNKANSLLNENKTDSVGYFLSIAYPKYPNEVENVITIRYLNDKKSVEKVVLDFIKYNKKSQKISIIALNFLIENKNYDEISKFSEIFPETTIIGGIIKFYDYLNNNDHLSALSKGSNVFDIISLYEIYKAVSNPYYKESETLTEIFKMFKNDYLNFACSNFYMNYCIKYANYIDDSLLRVKFYNLIIYYGFRELVYNSKSFDESFKNLENFTFLLIRNNCEDYDKLLTIFSSIYFDKESYEEYNKFLSLVDSVELNCPNKFNNKIKLLRAYAYRGLDRNKDAINILNSIKDSLQEPHKRFHIYTALSYLDFELVKKLIKEYNIKDSIILNYISEDNCEFLYNKKKYSEIIKKCSNDTPEKAYAYFMLSKDDSAISIIKNLIEDLEDSKKDYSYYWNKGWFKLLLKEQDSSYYYTKKALEMRENNSFILMNIGSIYLSKNQIDSAIYYYKKSYEVNLKYGNYNESSYFQTLKNDIELISKIYKIQKNVLNRIEKEIKALSKK